MKVEEATLQFIRDDSGRRCFAGEDSDLLYALGTPEKLYAHLLYYGYITHEPLLEKALEAVDDVKDHNLKNPNLTPNHSYKVKQIIRTLYEEATCSSTKQE